MASDPGSRTDRLISNVEPKLQDAVLRAIHEARGSLDIDLIEELIRHGRISELLDMLDGYAEGVADEFTVSYTDAGASTAAWIRNNVGVSAAFSPVIPRAASSVSMERLRIIREFTEKQREAARSSLVAGIRDGLNPKQQAIGFKDSIGLTEKQNAAVSNYRRLLEANSREALNRSLRDHRFDLAVERSIRNEVPLSGDQIDRIVVRYRERMIQRRATTIARTESLRAIHMAVNESYDQAIDNGLLSPVDVLKRWVTAPDERRRASHAFMQGQIRRQGEPFLTGAGNLIMYPGDPNAPASEVINCRCVVTRRIGVVDGRRD